MAFTKCNALFLFLTIVHLVSGQTEEEQSCSAAGAVVTAVIVTAIVTLAVVYVVYLWYKKKKSSQGKHLILETDPEKGKEEYAFDNPGFKDAALPIGKALEKNSKHESNNIAKPKWTQWSPLGVLGNKSDKKKTVDDTAIEQGGEVKVVALRSHDFTGLGFNICGNMRDGIFIKDVLHRGPASESGKLVAGDRINSVTISFEHMVYEDALTILSYASPYEVIIEAKGGKITTTPSQHAQPGHPIYRSSSSTDLMHIEKSAKKRLYQDEPYDSTSSYSSLQKSRSNATTLERSHSPAQLHIKQERKNKAPPKPLNLNPEQLKQQLEKRISDDHKAHLQMKEMQQPHPETVLKIETETQKTEANNKHQKFGVKVFPQTSPRTAESQNDNNINLERNESLPVVPDTKLSFDEVDKARIPPEVKKREKINKNVEQQQSKPEPFERSSLNGSGIKRDVNGIPQEIPNHMFNAAVAAKRNRRGSTEEVLVDDDIKSPKKSKGKAPAPPPHEYSEKLTNFHQIPPSAAKRTFEDAKFNFNATNLDEIHPVEEPDTPKNKKETETGKDDDNDDIIINPKESTSTSSKDYNSDSDMEGDNQSSVNTIELNASDITIHQVEADEELQNRKTASTGDLTKIHKGRKTSTGTLERAQSLDITDTSASTLKKRKGAKLEEDKSSDEDLYGKALINKEPRLSLVLDGLNTFQRNRLKKSTEWGNLEDAILNHSGSDWALDATLNGNDSDESFDLSGKSPEFSALVNKINEIKRETSSDDIEHSLTKEIELEMDAKLNDIRKKKNDIWPTDLFSKVSINDDEEEGILSVERPMEIDLPDDILSIPDSISATTESIKDEILNIPETTINFTAGNYAEMNENFMNKIPDAKNNDNEFKPTIANIENKLKEETFTNKVPENVNVNITANIPQTFNIRERETNLNFTGKVSETVHQTVQSKESEFTAKIPETFNIRERETLNLTGKLPETIQTVQSKQPEFGSKFTAKIPETFNFPERETLNLTGKVPETVQSKEEPETDSKFNNTNLSFRVSETIKKPETFNITLNKEPEIAVNKNKLPSQFSTNGEITLKTDITEIVKNPETRLRSFSGEIKPDFQKIRSNLKTTVDDVKEATEKKLPEIKARNSFEDISFKLNKIPESKSTRIDLDPKVEAETEVKVDIKAPERKSLSEFKKLRSSLENDVSEFKESTKNEVNALIASMQKAGLKVESDEPKITNEKIHKTINDVFKTPAAEAVEINQQKRNSSPSIEEINNIIDVVQKGLSRSSSTLSKLELEREREPEPKLQPQSQEEVKSTINPLKETLSFIENEKSHSIVEKPYFFEKIGSLKETNESDDIKVSRNSKEEPASSSSSSSIISNVTVTDSSDKEVKVKDKDNKVNINVNVNVSKPNQKMSSLSSTSSEVSSVIESVKINPSTKMIRDSPTMLNEQQNMTKYSSKTNFSGAISNNDFPAQQFKVLNNVNDVLDQPKEADLSVRKIVSVTAPDLIKNVTIAEAIHNLNNEVTVEGPSSLTLEINKPEVAVSELSSESSVSCNGTVTVKSTKLKTQESPEKVEVSNKKFNISHIPRTSSIPKMMSRSPDGKAAGNSSSMTYITEIQVTTPNNGNNGNSPPKTKNLDNEFESYVKNFESNVSKFESKIKDNEPPSPYSSKSSSSRSSLDGPKMDVEKELHKIKEIAEEQLKKLPEMRFTTSSYEGNKTPEKRQSSIEALRSNFEKSPSKSLKMDIVKSRIPVAKTGKTPPMSPERRDSRNIDLDGQKDIMEMMSSMNSTSPSLKYQPKTSSSSANKNVTVTSIRNSKIPSGLPTYSSRPPIPPRRTESVEETVHVTTSNGGSSESIRQWIFNQPDNSITNIVVDNKTDK